MEDLNKHQLILLTLLVSFVTSIATGIVTVTLLDQAPQDVTQNINRVVERTVERVVPGATQTVVKEVPVIVTEEELIVKAINSASGAVVAVLDNQNSSPKQVVSGFLLQPPGLVVAVLPTKAESNNSLPNYQVELETGKIFPVDVVKTDLPNKVMILKIKPDHMDEFTKETAKITPLKLSAKDTIVGQTAVGIGASSAGNHTVSVSIIAGLTTSSDDAEGPLLKTNASNPDNLGGPLLDIHGEVVGMNISSGIALPKSTIKSIIDSIK